MVFPLKLPCWGTWQKIALAKRHGNIFLRDHNNNRPSQPVFCMKFDWLRPDCWRFWVSFLDFSWHWIMLQNIKRPIYCALEIQSHFWIWLLLFASKSNFLLCAVSLVLSALFHKFEHVFWISGPFDHTGTWILTNIWSGCDTRNRNKY